MLLPFLLPARVFRPSTCPSTSSPLLSLASASSHSSFNRSARRYASSNAEVEAVEGASLFGEDDAGAGPSGSKRKRGGRLRWKDWVQGEGLRFKRPRDNGGGPNWLSEDGPFPLNRTFKPPAPISNALRNEIWMKFVASGSDPSVVGKRIKTLNPKDHPGAVKALSQDYGFSIPRIEAILRLKALEYLWEKEGRPLQNAFQEQMESYLGVLKSNNRSPTIVSLNDRKHSNAADQLDAETDPPTKSYVQTYYEMVEEGQIPILSTKVDKDRLAQLEGDAEKQVAATAHAKKDVKVFTPVTPGRPSFVFEDVHNRYLDTIDLKRRSAEAARRLKMREEDQLRRSELVKQRRMKLAEEAIARAQKRINDAKALKGVLAKASTSTSPSASAASEGQGQEIPAPTSA